MTHRLIPMVALAALATVLVGCSTVHDDTAVDDPGQRPSDAAGEPLDPGNYPTTPNKPMGTGGPDGAILEGQRLADFVVGPWEVDPTLVTYSYDGTMVWKNAAALAAFMAAPVPDIAARHDFLVGFVSSRSTSAPAADSRALSIGVLRFGSDADARAAAAEMGSSNPSAAGESAQSPMSLPGHPDAVTVGATLDDGTAVVQTFCAHGSYVLYAYARAPKGDRDAAAALVAKAVDLQTTRIDGFAPTNPSSFADLKIDPTGLLARTLPFAKGTGTIRNGTWGPQGALHFSIDPVRSAPAFAAGALQVKTYGQSMVFAAPDPTHAQRLFEAFNAAPSPGETPAAGVPGLPTARCTSSDADPLQPRFTCTLVIDRYVAVVAAGQATDAHQQAAAQYLILTAP